MQHIHQSDEYGCAIAVLAMLTGQTYANVAQDFDSVPEQERIAWRNQGVNHYQMVAYLKMQGYETRGVWRQHNLHLDDWPPVPFESAHYCIVKWRSGSRQHCCVWLHDGTVLDPYYIQKTSLDGCHEVIACVGVKRA